MIIDGDISFEDQNGTIKLFFYSNQNCIVAELITKSAEQYLQVILNKYMTSEEFIEMVDTDSLYHENIVNLYKQVEFLVRKNFE